MKIAWFCIPAHGHTNPTLGLVREMTAAGHEIRYFSFADFREKIEAAGAKFIPCDGVDIGMDDPDSGEKVGKDVSFATTLMVRATLALDGLISEEIQRFQPDLIVSDSVAFWGKLTAWKFGIPYVCSTTTFAFNRFSARYMKRGAGETLRMLFSMPKVNRQIRLLREKGYPVKGLLDIVQNDNSTNTIVYTSPLFQPCAETFSDRYHFIGPSIRPVMQPMQKTAEQTVFISMGTVLKNAELFRSCIEAVRGTGWQVIVSAGCSELPQDGLPDNVQVYESVDQMAVLSIADAFISHCGMNSVSESLWFGVPLVLFPQTPEQSAVAMRTAELGAGIRPASQSPDEIRQAVQNVLMQPAYKQAAQHISESFRNCGGITEAKAFLEACAEKR